MGCGDGRVDQCCGGDDINRPVAAGLAGDHMPQDHARDKKAAEADQAIGHKAQQAVVADDDAREEVQHIQAPIKRPRSWGDSGCCSLAGL